MYSLSTVASNYTNDMMSYFKNDLSWNDLIKKYGHLRPNTYNILSKRYDEDPEFYLKPSKDFLENQTPLNVNSWNKEKNTFLEKIVELGLSKNKNEAENFLKSALENREKAKFIFTRALSDSLELIKKYAKEISVNFDTIAETTLTSILNTENLTKKEARNHILNSAKLFRFKKNGHLPELISSTDNIFGFEHLISSGNYIGNKCVTGNSIYYSKTSHDNLEGKIVIIENADPGYDWLFSKKYTRFNYKIWWC